MLYRVLCKLLLARTGGWWATERQQTKHKPETGTITYSPTDLTYKLHYLGLSWYLPRQS